MCSSIIFFISEHDMKLEGRCMHLFTISWPYIVEHDCVSEDWVCVLISVFNYVFYRQKVQCVVTGGWLCGYWLDFVSCCFTVAWVGIHWGSIHWLQAQKIPLRPVTNIGIPTPFEHSGMLIKTSWAGFSRMVPPWTPRSVSGVFSPNLYLRTLIHVVIGDFIGERPNHWDKLIIS